MSRSPAPPVRIAHAAPEDAADWARMREALLPGEPDEHPREIAAYFAGDPHGPAAVLVARDAAGDAVGFAEVGVRAYAEGCYSGRVAYLEAWYVEPRARRGGVGGALVRACCEWARAQGFTEFASDALLENTLSQAAHRALGFEEVERIVCFRKDL
ncbi:MAG TPA: aminoglycoside 6'-N-acetyltransferase [Longimicrobium sp.]|nr:aminoglycoside 6'-N-acetyltransferase [Longimicrobium sp.]